ncbi:MAG: hypothetical protein ABW106_13160 [Steroidobacteraceae bacterium]
MSTKPATTAARSKNYWMAAATALQSSTSPQSLLSHWSRRQVGLQLWRSI